jgi:L-alanine-DL-glutamate epimerase-like enolase superfamily enzyme
MAVSRGEIEYTRWGVRDLLSEKATDIVQAGPNTAGGLTEWVRIAALCSAHHVPIAPHGNHYVGGHAVATVDNGMIVESYAGLHPRQDEFFTPMTIIDGERARRADAPRDRGRLDRSSTCLGARRRTALWWLGAALLGETPEI